MNMLDTLMPSNVETRRTLADMIMEKLNAVGATTEADNKKVRISAKANDGGTSNLPLTNESHQLMDYEKPGRQILQKA